MEQQPINEQPNNIEQRIITKSQLVEWVSNLPSSFELYSLFGGDRIRYVDEAAVVEVNKDIVSAASIAPKGEEFSGEPTIVGLYTIPEERQKGYGRMAFHMALTRCKERGFGRVRVDVLSNEAWNLIQSLPGEDKQYLDIHNMGGFEEEN